MPNGFALLVEQRIGMQISISILIILEISHYILRIFHLANAISAVLLLKISTNYVDLETIEEQGIYIQTKYMFLPPRSWTEEKVGKL